MKKLFIAIALFFIIGVLCSKTTYSQIRAVSDRPNVIFVYTDDEGKGLLGFEGQEIIKTPHVDKMASEGIVLQNSIGSMFCAPARASVLTGYSDLRKGKFILNRAGIYIDYLEGKISLEDVDKRIDNIVSGENTGIVLPQIFKKAGYVTGEIGKLEWGFATSRTQMRQHEWDYYYGYLDHRMCHGFYPMVMFENGEPIKIPGNTRPDSFVDSTVFKNGPIYPQFAENLFIAKAKDFIVSNKNRPFFLFYPTNLPHGPVSVPKIHADFKNDINLTEEQKMYASMVKMIDDNLGQMMNLIDSLGLSQNTIFVFGSDNGHYPFYYGEEEKVDNITTAFRSRNGKDIFNGNKGMAGIKTTNWNGGVIVPLVYYWPGGNFKSGVISDQLVANYDFISTMADLLQVKIDEEKDGRSYLDLLVGKEFEPHPHVSFSSFIGPALITRDGWKLRTYLGNGDPIFQLYYLPDDYAEELDVSKIYPEKLQRLKEELLIDCDGDFKNGIYDFENQPRTELGFIP